MTLEQRMTAAGWTAQELADVAPLLTNQKFRQTIESQLAEADTLKDQNTKLTKDLDTYDKWFTDEITPTVSNALKAAEEAQVAKAAAEARLKFIQEQGMKRQGQQQDPAAMQAEADRVAREAAEAARQNGKVDMKGYVNEETFNKAFDSTGDAIADAYDLGMDYQELFGSRLNMKQMRLEAKAARQPVRQYVESKFNFAGKRQEIEASKMQSKIDEAVKKREQELMVQFGGSNPNLRPLSASQNAFTTRRTADAGKQPWERNETELAASRIDKAFKKAVERGEVGAA